LVKPFSEPDPFRPELLPRGYKFASTACGLKANGRPDLALITSDTPATAAGVFTTNRVKAAPVLVSQEHLRSAATSIRAIISNSGNANCATGAAGLKASRATTARVARELGCRPEEVLVCSTGVIGVPLEVEKILRAIPDLMQEGARSAEAVVCLARAMMTTDTRPKWSVATFRVGGEQVNVLGFAKGAGMIHPQMATMLAFVITDAALTRPVAQRALSAVAPRTFNSITVDGDTSTNDTLFLLANGASGSPTLRAETGDYGRFVKVLENVCRDLALAIVTDGEGATRVAEIEIRGAPSDTLAEQVARTIATSPLVKTALAGGDPNWGRILAAAGRAPLPRGAGFDPLRVEIRLAGTTVCRRGEAYFFDENSVHQKLLERYVPVVVDLKSGRGRATVWTCDLTTEYVHINADYRS
jgi:glutamate N-acetyltransferase / amino-acid N-acetyltransferase